MGMFTVIKARNAANKYAKGDVQGALDLFKEAMDEGLTDLRYILNYSVLLIRQERYQEARDLLVKVQKYPMMDDQRRQLSDAETAGEKREAVNALYSTVTALYDALDPAVYKMNSIDKSYRTSLYDDISSAMQRIEANAYNAEASEFNALLDDFIPRIIASLAGIQPLELF